jgi:hypothetical protein
VWQFLKSHLRTNYSLVLLWITRKIFVLGSGITSSYWHISSRPELVYPKLLKVDALRQVFGVEGIKKKEKCQSQFPLLSQCSLLFPWTCRAEKGSVTARVTEPWMWPYLKCQQRLFRGCSLTPVSVNTMQLRPRGSPEAWGPRKSRRQNKPLNCVGGNTQFHFYCLLATNMLSVNKFK